jgi:hypothetical protein
MAGDLGIVSRCDVDLDITTEALSVVRHNGCFWLVG